MFINPLILKYIVGLNGKKKMKKSREEIAEAIINALEEGPLSIQQISEKINSNWSTVSEILNKLRRLGKIKEIVSTSKIKIYQLIRRDTYYGIPIGKKEKKFCRYLFFNIIEQFKKICGRLPNKTEAAKIATPIIDSFKPNLPTAWYLYGKIPLMILSPSQDYQIDFSPPNHEEIIKEIITEIKKQRLETKSTREIRKAQYRRYGKIIYDIKEKIIDLLFRQKFNNEKLLDKFDEFLLHCPTKDDASRIFYLIDELTVSVHKLALVAKLDKFRKEIFSAFDSVWKAVALYFLFDSITEYPKYSNRKEMMKLYFEKPFETKIATAEEALSNLESIYLGKLKLSAKLSPETKEIRGILSEMTED